MLKWKTVATVRVQGGIKMKIETGILFEFYFVSIWQRSEMREDKIQELELGVSFEHSPHATPKKDSLVKCGKFVNIWEENAPYFF